MNQVTADSPAASPAIDFRFRELETLGHPKGLLVLTGTEFWDRVSFHGMQALLVLYMVEQLLLPGHVEHVLGFAGFRTAMESVTGPLSTQALAFQIYAASVNARRLRRELGAVGRTDRRAAVG